MVQALGASGFSLWLGTSREGLHRAVVRRPPASNSRLSERKPCSARNVGVRRSRGFGFGELYGKVRLSRLRGSGEVCKHGLQQDAIPKTAVLDHKLGLSELRASTERELEDSKRTPGPKQEDTKGRAFMLPMLARSLCECTHDKNENSASTDKVEKRRKDLYRSTRLPEEQSSSRPVLPSTPPSPMPCAVEALIYGIPAYRV